LLEATKSVDVSALYDARNYRAKLMRVEGMPMFLY
jgi:6-phosphofructokinase 1